MACLAAPAAFPAQALAHATLLRTDPAAGTRVRTQPAQLTLTFDQQVRPVTGATSVVDEQGQSVTGGEPRSSDANVRQLVIPLRQGLPDGDYTVHWEVVSTDGHLISGVYAIGLGAGGPPPQAAEQNTPLDWPYLVARFVYFAGLLLLVGGVVYRVAVYQPAAAAVTGEPGRLMGLRERHRANQVLAASAVLVLAGGWVALTRQGAEVAGVSFWEAFDHRGPVASALDATRFGRQFGRGIDVTAVFTILVALAYAAAAYSRRLTLALAVPALAAGVWALAAPGIAGHAGDPGRGPLVIGLDAVHVAAAAVWIGGLLQLALVTPHATRGLAEAQRAAVRSDVAHRFSRIALWSVAVLAASGVLRAIWELSDVSQLWTTSYGKTLLAKSLLLLATLVIASRSRGLLDRFGPLRRSVTGELAVLAAVVAAVALLTNLPPANVPSAASAATSAPAGGPATVALSRRAALSMWPGRSGANAIGLSLPADAGLPSLLLQREDGGRIPATLERVARGQWLAWLPRLPAGRVLAQVASGKNTWAATLEVGPPQRSPGIPPQPAARGPVAAGEAADLAVAAQRVGARGVRFTVLGPDGSAPRRLAVVANGVLATPCLDTPEVCYQAPLAGHTRALAVSVLRSGANPVKATLDLPPAGAADAGRLVRQTAIALRALRTVRIENELASDPVHSVHTRFIAQSPDRLSIDVTGGTRSIVIGHRRWNFVDGQWKQQATAAVRVPDPFWAPGALAATVAGETADTIELTLAVPQGPTFFRLLVDRRTHLVQHLWMTTAAHFMQDRYLDFNSAPPVTPPVS